MHCKYLHSSVSSLYGRVYRNSCNINTLGKSFLPVWEGVSVSFNEFTHIIEFPPCMGGCIAAPIVEKSFKNVSSLYGRVYRRGDRHGHCKNSFLPIREGVSPFCSTLLMDRRFPPYTGGCIAYMKIKTGRQDVSSLYGRVYRGL